MPDDTEQGPGPGLEDLFARACELGPEARDALVADLRRSDPDVAEALLRMLAADRRTGTRFERPVELSAAELTGEPPRPGVSDWAGRDLGPFRILGHLGRGGMGEVLEARQPRPARRVALKVVPLGEVGREGLDRRFEAEADTLAALDHPNVARVYGAGRARLEGVEYAWMAVELIERPQTLTAFAASRALDLRQRVELFLGVAEALHHAHRKGVLHRDLKPANLLVSEVGDGTPKVIDFGLARWLEPVGPREAERTREGELLGTLHYMSPEQADGDPGRIDVRSDVYGLGVVLYELLCGSLPYALEGLSILETLVAIRGTPAQDPRELRPEIDADLAAVLTCALRKHPEERYESAGELGRDLAAWLAREPIRARRPSVAHRVRLFARRKRGLSAGLAAAGLVLVLATGWILSQQVEIRRELGKRLAAERAAEMEREATAAARLELSGLQDTLDGLLSEDYLPALLDEARAAQVSAEDDDERRAAVGRAVDELERLAQRLAGDPASDARLARAFVSVGDLMGNWWMARAAEVEPSVPAYEAATAAWRRVLAQRPDDRGARAEFQSTLDSLSRALRKLGAGREPSEEVVAVRERARRVAEEAVSIGRARLAVDPADIDAAIALNDSLQCLSDVHISLPPYERGGQLTAEATELMESCYARAPEHSGLRRALAWSRFSRAIWDSYQGGRAAEAAAGAARSHVLLAGHARALAQAGDPQRRLDRELQGLLEFVAWNDFAFSMAVEEPDVAALEQRIEASLDLAEAHADEARTLATGLPYAAYLMQRAQGESRAKAAARLESWTATLAASPASAATARELVGRFGWLDEGTRSAVTGSLPGPDEESGPPEEPGDS